MSLVFYDGSVTGLDKINLISLLKSFVQSSDIKFNEKSGVVTNVRLSNKRTFEGNLQVIRLVGRIVRELYSNDPVESTVVICYYDCLIDLI
jgi:hypothetical protein